MKSKRESISSKVNFKRDFEKKQQNTGNTENTERNTTHNRYIQYLNMNAHKYGW